MKITSKSILAYHEYLINEEKSAQTSQKYVREAARLSAWLSDREIDKSKTLEYKEYLIKSLTPSSVNTVIAALNSFFTFLKCFHLKLKSIKIQKQTFLSENKELTIEEYERLLEAAKECGNERLYYILQTICSTGIRISELQYITVESLQLREATVKCKGKMRVALLPKQLCRALQKYARKKGIITGSIFVTRSGNPVDRSNVWREMKKLCETAGVLPEKVFPHNLRHLFARTFYSRQKDVVRLADILGHSNVNTTRIYTMESGYIHRRQIQDLGLLRC